jgi:hypothetical protein
LLALAVLSLAAEARGSVPTARVRVMLQNDGIAPTDVLESAQREVVRLFAMIDVDVVWVSDPIDDPRSVRYVKVTNWEPTDSHIPLTTLGVTFAGERGTGKRAYVMWTRVQRQAWRHAVGLDTMLAIAIAHEIGHVVSPKNAHTSSGLMRESWDANDLRLAAAGMLSFSRDSATKIAQGLRPGVAIAGRR